MKNNKYYSLLLLVLVVILGACGGQSQEASFDTSLLPLSIGEEIGYTNSEGKFLINPQFKEAHLFAKNGLAKVKKDDKYGFINKEGKLVIPYQYHQATSFYEGFACVVTDASAPFYINEKGERKIELKRAEHASHFAEGFAPFSIKKKDSEEEIWGFINSKGEEKIAANYKNVKHFSQGLAGFREGGKWGFLDTEGKIIINPQFTEAYLFQEGLAVVQNEKGKWGAIDKSGVLKIDYQFDGMTNFSEGMAGVRSGSMWGYVDKDGKLVINPQFEQAMTFKNGIAIIKKDKKMGLIDKKGALLVNPQFTDAYIIGNSILVNVEGKVGITDLKGKYTANPQFAKVNKFIIDILITENPAYLNSVDLSKFLYVNTQAENITENSSSNITETPKTEDVQATQESKQQKELDTKYASHNYYKNNVTEYLEVKVDGSVYYSTSARPNPVKMLVTKTSSNEFMLRFPKDAGDNELYQMTKSNGNIIITTEKGKEQIYTDITNAGSL